MRFAKSLIAAGSAIVLAGCNSLGPRTLVDNDTQDKASVTASVLFLADPQVHNVHGGGVKQSMGVADLFSDVAQRYPEMNLLSTYALQDAIKNGLERLAPAPAPGEFMVLLGDATNAGCTGEFRRFVDAVNDVRGNRILLMAHGNHDSYLMGTINYWQSRLDEADVTAFANADFPKDASWWKPAQDPKASGWKALCYEDGTQESVPIHKVQWMAKYLDTLKKEPAGLKLETAAAIGKDAIGFIGKGRPGGLLDRLGYRLEGEWIRPVASDTGLSRTYDSFLIQAVDVESTHRMIIVDTSACAELDAPLIQKPIRYWGQNFGMRGCMGDAQLRRLSSWIASEKSSNRKIVFAGHFPLKDISSGDQKRFVELMKAASGESWTYLSAHTHDPQSVLLTQGGGKEINMGSTTDWPMASYAVRFGQSVTAEPIQSKRRAITYRAPWYFPFGTELCRHVDAASALAAWDTDESLSEYRSPGTWGAYLRCANNLPAYQDELRKALATIAQRMKTEPYRTQMLDIMAQASYRESKSFSFRRLFRRFIK